MIAFNQLNLLPPEDRARIGYERLTRFFTLFYGSIAALLLIGIILALPTYFFVFFQNRGIAELITASRQAAESEQARETEARIQKTNAKLRRLEKYYAAPSLSTTDTLREILTKTPAGITFTRLSLKNETGDAAIQGTAAIRDDLLQFLTALRGNPLFANVESPVENILRERNLSFKISFTIRNNPQQP